MPWDDRRKRLLFRSSYTGIKEMDLLLGGFARVHLEGFTDAQLASYEALLVDDDPLLYRWITGQTKPPPDKESDVLDMLRRYRYTP
jgi:antitoxin CptB